jgi:hypothetical protein
MKTAIQLRDEGIQQVEDNANAAWTNLVLKIIQELSAQCSTLTSDDVWLELQKYPETKTHQPSAMGAMFRRAFSIGFIVSTDSFVLSKRPSSHARPIRVWQSNIKKGK